MGRSKKYAVDDFLVTVKFFESDNREMLFLRRKYGYLADAIYGKLYALILKHGYYFEFDSVEYLTALIAQTYGEKFAKMEKISAVILDLVNAGIFDYGLYQINVLTSEKIQRYYLKAVERRLISIPEKYWLLKVNKNCRTQNSKNVDINRINDNINKINVDSKTATNTSIVSEVKSNNKLINNISAGAREQNKQNNTQNNARNIISDDFDITPEELDELKKQFIDCLKLAYPGDEWTVDIMLNNENHKKHYDLVIDALLKASRLRHKITLSGQSYGAEYFRDIIQTISLDNLAKISDIVRQRADDVKNVDFFILGTTVKLFDNQC